MEMNEFEYTSIFIESSENLGVVFDSYKKLGPDTEAFLDKIEDAVNDLNKKADEAKINLKGDITAYKNSLACKKEPEPIDIRKVKSLKAKIKLFRFKLDTMLNRLARIKDKVAYGGNYLRAIINRPKVYGHDMNDEKYTKTNNNIREVNRAIDWVEKAMVDLFNLVDQDLNILTIVDKIYASNKIFEGTEELPGGCYIGETDADIAQLLPGSGDKVSEAGNYMYNSLDKKSGTAPSYLKRNHDMASYGEDEPDNTSNKTLDDYRHPDDENNDLDDIINRKTKKKTVVNDDDDDEPTSKPSSSSSNGAPVNYYYYTYQNSLNKNTDSFNKYKTDDHSTGKQINSNNTTSTTKDDSGDDKKEYKTISKEEAVEESVESDRNAEIGKVVKKLMIMAKSLKKELWPIAKETAKKTPKVGSIFIGKQMYVYPGTSDRYDDSIFKAMTKEIVRNLIDKNSDTVYLWVVMNFTTYDTIRGIPSGDLDEFKRNLIKEIPSALKKAGIQPKNKSYEITGTDSNSFTKNKDLTALNEYYIYISSKTYSLTFPIAISTDDILAGVNTKLFESFNDLMEDVVATYCDSVINESAKPWELNIFPEVITEGFFDKFKSSETHIVKPNMHLSDTMQTMFNSYLKNFKSNLINKMSLEEFDILKPVSTELIQMINTFKVNPNDIVAHIDIGKNNGIKCTLMSIYETDPPIPEDFPGYDLLMTKGIDVESTYNHEGPANGEDIASAMNIYVHKLFDDTCVEFNIGNASSPFFNTAKMLHFRINFDLKPAGIKDFIDTNNLGNELNPVMSKYGINVESTMTEDVGDADDDKPQADHPVRDAMIDADRAMQSKFQDIKKTGQAGVHLYRTATRPVRRVKEFLNQQIAKWKDADETEIKERLADPNARKNVFHAIKVAIDNGAYLKAGILLNPVILGLHTLKKVWGKSAEGRIKNEMLLELQQEMDIIDEKIRDAGKNDDNKAKYQLMRFKTEVQKKLWRVAGANTGSLAAIHAHKTPGVSKFI